MHHCENSRKLFLSFINASGGIAALPTHLLEHSARDVGRHYEVEKRKGTSHLRTFKF